MSTPYYLTFSFVIEKCDQRGRLSKYGVYTPDAQLSKLMVLDQTSALNKVWGLCILWVKFIIR